MIPERPEHDPSHSAPPKAMGMLEACRAALPDAARFAAAFWVVLLVMVAAVAAFVSSKSLLHLAVFGHGIVATSSIYAVVMSATQRVIASKQRLRRHQLQSALAQLGEAGDGAVAVSPRERAGRFGRDFKFMLASMLGFEIGIGQGVARDMIAAWSNGTFDAASVALMLLVLLPVPLYLGAMFWRESRGASATDALERTERAFAAATEDRAQLVGGLEVERATARDGGLSMQVTAGGMEVREEVVLGTSDSASVDEVSAERSVTARGGR